MVTHVNTKHPALVADISGNSQRHNRVGTADECYRAMQLHNARCRGAPTTIANEHKDETAPRSDAINSGDIIYGARSIAEYLFADGGNRARRRVFNLWAHYSVRKEKAGFFKLKGALCLSKSQWRSFHGLQ